MFGFSLTKLLVLAAAVIVVWYGIRWLQGLPRPAARERLRRGRDAGPDADVVDLRRDEETGDYVAVDPDRPPRE